MHKTENVVLNNSIFTSKPLLIFYLGTRRSKKKMFIDSIEKYY